MTSLAVQFSKLRRQAFREITQSIKRVCHEGGAFMTAHAKEQLTNEKGYQSRNLINSIKANVKSDKNSITLEFGAYATNKKVAYGLMREKGRGVSRKRDDSILTALRSWVRHAFRSGKLKPRNGEKITDSKINSLASWLRIKKAREKTPAKPFMKPAFENGLRHMEGKL